MRVWAFMCIHVFVGGLGLSLRFPADVGDGNYDKKENRYLSYTICTMPVYEIKKHSQKERCVFSTSSPVELLKSSFIPHLGALLPQEQVITNEMIF